MKEIDYIEFWATQHCNLNCKGCSSCSPISDEWYLNPSDIENDLNQLKSLGINVNNINILGGEPLLHPKITEIFNVVKKIYPTVNLGLLTNGLLLLNMKDEFWDNCKKYNIKINVTWFPVLNKKTIDQIINRVLLYGIRYKITKKTMFNKILVEENDSLIEDVILACGCNNAYNLKNGFMSRCTVPMIVDRFNEHFGTKLVSGGKINIYEVSADEIMGFLNTPNETCQNCSAHPIKVVWEKSNKFPQKSDWLIGK